jgi:hypothetical protein
MKTKKMNLREFRDLVKTIIEEEMAQEELNEFSWGGLKGAAGLIGGKIKDASTQVGSTIKKGAQDVQQAYKTGADKAKYEKAKNELAKIAEKMMQLKKASKEQMNQLQQQYSALTGGKLFKGAVHNPVMNEGRLQWMTESEIRNAGTNYATQLNKTTSLDGLESNMRNQNDLTAAFQGWYTQFKNLKLTPQQIMDAVKKAIPNLGLDQKKS